MANYSEKLNSSKNITLWGTIFGVDNNTGIMNWFLKIELQVDGVIRFRVSTMNGQWVDNLVSYENRLSSYPSASNQCKVAMYKSIQQHG
jgi:hypothetical protein